MTEIGKGEYQERKAEAATKKIIKALNDGQWHRYQELQKSTSLSTATLSKHLKKLEKGIIERHVNVETEYPPPVYYRLRTELFPKLQPIPAEKTHYFTQKYKEPRYDVHLLNSLMGNTLLGFLELYSQDPKQKEEMFDQAVEHYIISQLREYIQQLKLKVKELSESDNVDVNKLLLNSINQFRDDYSLLFKVITKKDSKREKSEEILKKLNLS